MLSIVFSRARVQGELLSETFTCAQRTGEPIEEDVEARKFCTVLPTAENNCTICQLFVMLWCLLKVSIGFHPFSALINHNYQSRLPTFAGKSPHLARLWRWKLLSVRGQDCSARRRERERAREREGAGAGARAASCISYIHVLSTYIPAPCHLSPKNGEHPSISTIVIIAQS